MISEGWDDGPAAPLRFCGRYIAPSKVLKRLDPILNRRVR